MDVFGACDTLTEIRVSASYVGSFADSLKQVIEDLDIECLVTYPPQPVRDEIFTATMLYADTST